MTQKEWQRDNEAWERQVEKERMMADAILGPFRGILDLLGGEDRPISSTKIATILRIAVAEGEAIRDGD
ncbi:MAG: hypothetical protein GX433_00010 [Deltaproteobacteria bacterium]|nr:hypothetical protein [Deltaproteobacteria bacterium]